MRAHRTPLRFPRRRLSNEESFPNVARAIANDTHHALAIAEVCADREWTRVALVHDDSTWGLGGAAAFQDSFGARGMVILPGGLVNITEDDFNSGKVHARDILEQLRAASAKVIVLVVQPYIQRALYAWSFDNDVLYGPGFGWISFWPSEEALHNADGGYNASALQGAEGLISILLSFDTSRDVLKSLVSLWSQASSSECDGSQYCDADGDPETWPEYAANGADAVLLYAHAMDQLRRTAPLSMDDPDVLYETMKQLPPFEGMTGLVSLDDTGDKHSRLTIVNLQMCGSSNGECGLRRRLSSVFKAEFFFRFVKISAEYDSLTEKLTVSLAPITRCAMPCDTALPLNRSPPRPSRRYRDRSMVSSSPRAPSLCPSQLLRPTRRPARRSPPQPSPRRLRWTRRSCAKLLFGCGS